MTIQTDLLPAAAHVWSWVCIRVCALLIVYFYTVEVFFLLDSDLGTSQICQYCAFLSASGAHATHYTAGFWTFLCLRAVFVRRGTEVPITAVIAQF